MKAGEISRVQKAIYTMVNNFVNEYVVEWEKVREEKRQESVDEHKKLFPNDDYVGIAPGRSLSLQSYIASDLLIDFWYLAHSMEMEKPFVYEYWIRSNGVQCIKSRDDLNYNRGVWGDVLAKFIIEFDGYEVKRIDWFQDNDCLVMNKFVVDNEEVKKLSYSNHK